MLRGGQGLGLEYLLNPEGFLRAASYMSSLPQREGYSRDELLVPALSLRQSDHLVEYYAPHNETVNIHAAVIIAGLTPGWKQMEIALRTMRNAIQAGLQPVEVCLRAKREARFAGTMRRELTAMLEGLGLQTKLEEWRLVMGNTMLEPDEAVDDSHPLTILDHQLVHTTSLLPCPVFRNGANYTGHQPQLARSAFLMELVRVHMRAELSRLQDPLIIPLGRAVEEALRLLITDGLVREDKVLWGFPHPSGANGHRHAQFVAALPSMKKQLSLYDPAEDRYS